MRLSDTYIIQNLRIISESASTGLMKISGKFQEADSLNNNKRVYPKALLEREVKKLQESIMGQRLVGELDHPEYDSVKLSNVSHMITGLKMKGNDVLGEAVILNTPAGQVAQQLIKGGVSVGISSRGLGTLTELEEGTKQVNEDYNLVTFDLVADPSTKGAYPSLTESTIIEKIVRETSNKIGQETLLVHLLKKKLNHEAKDKLAFNESSYNESVARGRSIRECILEGVEKEEKSTKERMKDILREADKRTPNQISAGGKARGEEYKRSKGKSSTARLEKVKNRASAREDPGAKIPGLGRTSLRTDKGPTLDQVSGTKNPDLKAKLISRREAALAASTPKRKLPGQTPKSSGGSYKKKNPLTPGAAAQLSDLDWPVMKKQSKK
jgi:hypothetical protein